MTTKTTNGIEDIPFLFFQYFDTEELAERTIESDEKFEEALKIILEQWGIFEVSPVQMADLKQEIRNTHRVRIQLGMS